MPKLREFIKRAPIVGLVVILPMAVVVYFFRRVYALLTNLRQPISNLSIKARGFPDLRVDSAMRTVISCGTPVQARCLRRPSQPRFLREGYRRAAVERLIQ